MPIKEISAESVRDKSIRHGHISTLHLWWARRPLPTCRAVVFASLVPDPDDPACPRAFVEAVRTLLSSDDCKPYDDIPYTPASDPVLDTPRNRLTSFIAKFSAKCAKNMIAGKSTPPKEQLSDACLVKWESKSNPAIIGTAQELIYVAFNAERDTSQSFASLDGAFKERKAAIARAEETLYAISDRHLQRDEVKSAEEELERAIKAFQDEMPEVFDPFAGGGAIPLEAARLGCRASGNDINPVAHIIERASADFPQRYGKPIIYSRKEFHRLYGDEGFKLLEGDEGAALLEEDSVSVQNRLAFDVEFWARRILKGAKERVGHLYPKDEAGREPIAFYWARVATCSNASCRAQVPLLKQFYLANTKSKHVWLHPHISGKEITFTIESGKYSEREFPGWNKHGTLTCPCCGSVTDIDEVKRQSKDGGLPERLIAVITEGDGGKSYSAATEELQRKLTENVPQVERPQENMTRNSNGGDTFPWGYTKWGQLFSSRQLCALQAFLGEFARVKVQLGGGEYAKALITFLAVWIDRIALFNTSFGRWHVVGEKIEHPYARQAIPMIFDYPESNPFCSRTGSAINQLEWITRYIEEESSSSFPAHFFPASSSEEQRFDPKSLTACVTDPPYYDAIAYADCSDFFYVWLKRTLGDVYPENFATAQTPKADECTALKHHHGGSEAEAKAHFEAKLTQIFDAIEAQTEGTVAVMFAHQSTQAWTTLLNSVLGARMNITGSWPMDTEMANRSIGLAGAALESSVTVACRPVERRGVGSYRKVKSAIEVKVKGEVQKLYALGFRGADLLTACFGQAVSAVGDYESVEKGDGTPVSVEELLKLTRALAAESLEENLDMAIKTSDEYTRFYCSWLMVGGTTPFSIDDARLFVQNALSVDIKQIRAEGLIAQDIAEGKEGHKGEGAMFHLSSADEHLAGDEKKGMREKDPLIAKVHKAMQLYSSADSGKVVEFLAKTAPSFDDPFWSVINMLSVNLSDCEDKRSAKGLASNARAFSEKASARKAAMSPDDVQGKLDV